jgi:phospholipid/cholesterol/gamma-HCH transport system permease protein
LIKGLFFGVAITSIACYQGYYTSGGATGVGKSTTATVVISCVAIVFLDYILAAILL